MKIAMIGTGYVGLVTGTCFAESGNEVVCIDKDEKKIATLEAGGLPIYEPGLLELVMRNRREGRLHFTTNLAEGIADAPVIYLAVGTPQGDDGSADLSALWAVADAIAEHAKTPKTVVVKSTVPVGTNRKLAERLASKAKVKLETASNPEFLKEGAAVEDCMKPDRVVVGVRNPETSRLLHTLYAPFLRTERPFLVMSPESAEMTKYVANAMLATKISFINEMANLCEKMGADVNDVRRGIGHDARIGFQFLFPGAGYGGSCFEANETVFVVESGGVRARPIASLFPAEGVRSAWCLAPAEVAAGAESDGWTIAPTATLATESEAVEVHEPEDLKVLAVDLETGGPTLADVRALTRRPYRGPMVDIRTSMGRSLRVTGDHPVIRLRGEEFETVLAHDVAVGDELLALCTLPAVEPAEDFNLIERLRGTALEQDVHVSPVDESFTQQYEQFARHIPQQFLKYPVEIRDHNRMPLRIYRHLSERGVLDVPVDKLRLYTAKGAATRLNARIPIDGDLLRLCGYYLAEGFISKDIGRAGAVRERVGFSFHEDETGYIEDVRRILRRWGLKFIERHSTHARTTIVSSRVFAWFLRDVLQCGTRSEDKALPRLAFNVAPELRRELVRGAFSGDGAVTKLQGGRNLMFEYATVSKPLADGMTLLLQTLGVVPSLRRRMMNKSTRLAHIVRVAGYHQVEALRDVFGDKHRAAIDAVLARYERHIRQHGFRRCGPFAVLTVRSVEREEADTAVYSLETTTHTLIGASGLLLDNCFPKDVRALIAIARQAGATSHIMESVDRVNELQKSVLFAKIKAHYGSGLKGKTLAIWGLSFKPRTDDIREAPALVLIDALLKEGVTVRVHDPEALPNVRAIHGDRLVYCDRPYGALEGANGLAIVTEWQEFRNPDFEVVRRLLREPVIFDGRNLYDAASLAEMGFVYHSIGRETAGKWEA